METDKCRKKVGILTLPLHTNYGGILQAYALQKVLEDRGYAAIHLNGERTCVKFPLWKLPLSYVKRLILKFFFNRKVEIFFIRKRNKEIAEISINTTKFINKYINISNIPPKKLPVNFVDTIVVGSDQIWRPIYNRDRDIKDAFLSFAKKWTIKRVAYAPSFGVGDWEFSKKDTKQCGRLLQQFDAVSLRELSGLSLCKKYFDVDAQHVLDPTMLLNVDEYIKLVENFGDLSSKPGELMCYILDDTADKSRAINLICERYKYAAFRTGSKVESEEAKIEEKIQPPVEEWIKGFMDAKFVITDSFHAAVFSILFNKPFVVYGNQSRGLDRFSSLLSIFGLENRLIFNSESLNEAAFEIINWQSVNEKLELMKVKSYNFLFEKLD